MIEGTKVQQTNLILYNIVKYTIHACASDIFFSFFPFFLFFCLFITENLRKENSQYQNCAWTAIIEEQRVLILLLLAETLILLFYPFQYYYGQFN